jgi:uncharacterized SAM-binding protein YcdF (DUF218 family)
VWKKIKRYLFLLAILFTCGLTAEFLFFLGVLLGPIRLAPADLIVVFQGREERARTAYHLVDLDFAPALVISPATDQQLAGYDHAYRPMHHFDKIMELKARTTFENALYTTRILKKHGFHSAILVTSWNHMPRSYLLLSMMLIGTRVHIQCHSAATGRLNRQNWYCHTIGWKMIYNEMIETWGSLLEWMDYGIHGGPSATAPGKAGLLSGLKKILLFKIDPKTLVVAPS